MRATKPISGEDQRAAAVSLDGARLTYPDGTVAVDGFTLDIPARGVTALLGVSGAGKSSVLRLIAGLAEPSAGRVERRVPIDPGAVSMVFQDPTLMPWADVGDNVWFPLRLAGVSRADAAPAIAAALDRVGLSQAAHRRPAELSGGMRMRAAIARALVTEPKLLLMDEPFAALDEPTRNRLDDDLLAIVEENAIAVVFVTHSVSEAAYLASRVAIVDGPPAHVARLFEDERPVERNAAWRRSAAFAARAAAMLEALEATGAAKGFLTRAT